MLLNDERLVKSDSSSEVDDKESQPLVVALVYNNKPAPSNNSSGQK